MFSSIPGIYPLDASNTPTHTLVVTIKYNSRHCQMSPGGGGAKSPQLRATELDLESEMPTIISCYTNERRSDERKANSRAYVLSKKEDNPHLQWPSPYVTIVQERAWIPWFCKVSWLSPFFNVGNSFFVAHRKVGSGATLPELESQVYLPTNLNIGQVL